MIFPIGYACLRGLFLRHRIILWNSSFWVPSRGLKKKAIFEVFEQSCVKKHRKSKVLLSNFVLNTKLNVFILNYDKIQTI